MNPKQIISMVAILLLGGGGFLWYSFSRSNSGSEEVEYDPIRSSFVLAEDRKKLLWQHEHMVVELEMRMLPQMIAGISEKKNFRIENLIRDAAVCETSSHANTMDIDTANLAKVSTEQVSRTKVGKSAFAKSLVDLHRGLSQTLRSHGQILSIQLQDESQNRWNARIRLVLEGVDENERSIRYSSLHELTLIVEDEKKLGEVPSIEKWNLLKIRKWRSNRVYFENVSEQYGLDRLELLDDWVIQLDYIEKQKAKKNPDPEPEAVKMYHYQYAVADFDSDGRVEIACASLGGNPHLFDYREGKGFVDIAHRAGLKEWDNELSSGKFLCFWIDFNDDGVPDLFLGNSLYRNDGKSNFTDVTQESGFEVHEGCMGAVIADYDCDGLQDVYLIYSDVTSPAKSLSSWVYPQPIFRRNELWHNEGNGKFLNVTLSSNSDGGRRPTHSAAWFFYDDDRFPDLINVNRLHTNAILRNNRDGTFSPVDASKGFSRYTFSYGVAVGDVDNDGSSDIFVSGAYSTAGNRVLRLMNKDDYPEGVYDRIKELNGGNALYLGSSSTGILKESAERFAIKRGGWGFGPTMIDVQNDGWLDVYSTSGLKSFSPQQRSQDSYWWKGILIQPLNKMPESEVFSIPEGIEHDPAILELSEMNSASIPAWRLNLFSYQPNRLYLNLSGERFVDATFTSGADATSDSRTAIAVDFDGDGAQDLLVASVGGGPLHLLLNRAPQQNRIRLNLTGVESNKMAIGSRIVIHCGNRKIYRDLFPANGFHGMGPAESIIGVGKAETIDKLEIRWPNGKKQEFQNIPVNKAIAIEEGSKSFTATPFSLRKAG